MPTLPHEAIVADVVYPSVLLAHSRSLILLFAMIGCLQSGLPVLFQSLCNVEVEEDNESNVVIGPDCEPKVKTLNPHVELSYTYFMAWYVMHCLSFMLVVQSSEASMAFVQRLKHSRCHGWYMLMIRQIL